MKFDWRSLLLVAGLGTGLATSGCVVRAAVRPAHVVSQRPPAPQYVSAPPRAGHIHVKGHWEWRQNAWAWQSGRYVRDRQGHRYVDGRWEQRGNRWHWIDGRWVTSSSSAAPQRSQVRDHRQGAQAPAVLPYPVTAPPPNRYQQPKETRVGHVWIPGYYEWRNGAYAWTLGHWERVRENQAWTEGQWVEQGGRWVWKDGYWQGQQGIAQPRKNQRVPARPARPQ